VRPPFTRKRPKLSRRATWRPGDNFVWISMHSACRPNSPPREYNGGFSATCLGMTLTCLQATRCLALCNPF